MSCHLEHLRVRRVGWARSERLINRKTRILSLYISVSRKPSSYPWVFVFRALELRRRNMRERSVAKKAFSVTQIKSPADVGKGLEQKASMWLCICSTCDQHPTIQDEQVHDDNLHASEKVCRPHIQEKCLPTSYPSERSADLISPSEQRI
jgi:hypothetical protein